MAAINVIELNGKEKQIEDVIKQLKGILSCNAVICQDEAIIKEIHIFAEGDRLPKQVVRDVESAIKAQLGIEIDHKKISVAQTKDSSPVFEHNRPIIDKIEVHGSRNWIKSKIYLQLGKEIYEGNSEGPNSGLNRYKIIATATLVCIETILNKKLKFFVEDFTWQSLSDFDVGTVIISCVTDNKIQTLVGSSLSDQDKDTTTVKAVLDAINRRFNVIS